jgi:hypothetical protein
MPLLTIAVRAPRRGQDRAAGPHHRRGPTLGRGEVAAPYVLVGDGCRLSSPWSAVAAGPKCNARTLYVRPLVDLPCADHPQYLGRLIRRDSGSRRPSKASMVGRSWSVWNVSVPSTCSSTAPASASPGKRGRTSTPGRVGCRALEQRATGVPDHAPEVDQAPYLRVSDVRPAEHAGAPGDLPRPPVPSTVSGIALAHASLSWFHAPDAVKRDAIETMWLQLMAQIRPSGPYCGASPDGGTRGPYTLPFRLGHSQ